TGKRRREDLSAKVYQSLANGGTFGIGVAAPVKFNPSLKDGDAKMSDWISKGICLRGERNSEGPTGGRVPHLVKSLPKTSIHARGKEKEKIPTEIAVVEHCWSTDCGRFEGL